MRWFPSLAVKFCVVVVVTLLPSHLFSLDRDADGIDDSLEMQLAIALHVFGWCSSSEQNRYSLCAPVQQ